MLKLNLTLGRGLYKLAARFHLAFSLGRLLISDPAYEDSF
jgi:hypothetical protein